MMLKIKETVRCFQIGDNTYVRDTGTYKDYLFNTIVYDIFRILSETGGCTAEQVLKKLAAEYAVEDEETFNNDILSFLEELFNEGILETADEKAGGNDESVSDQLMEYCAEHHLLFNACLELTYRCNERCIHCYIDDQKFGKEMSLADYHSVIDQLCELGCVSLLLTGGEVSLHPDFIEIADYASAKGLLINIYTNGYNISDELLERMIALHPNSISFSLYSADPQIHDSVTGVPGSFERSLRTAVLCKCAGIDTFIKTIALRQNADSLEGLFRLGELYHIPVELAMLVLRSHLETKRLSQLRLGKPEDFAKLFRLEEKYKRTIPGERTLCESRPVCQAGRYALTIDPYGQVFPCIGLNISLGDIHRQSLKEIWEGCEAILDEKMPRGCLSTHCISCENKRYCNMCPANVLDGNGNLRWDDGICAITQGAVRFLEERRAN